MEEEARCQALRNILQQVRQRRREREKVVTASLCPSVIHTREHLVKSTSTFNRWRRIGCVRQLAQSKV